MSSIFHLVENTSVTNPDWHDLELVDGKTVFIDEGDEMVAQRCRTRLLSVKGEWYQDQRQGVPWMNEILGMRPTATRLESIFRNALKQIPGLAEIESLVVERTDDGYALSYSAITELGYKITVDQMSIPFEVSV